ncbi:MAG TPA: LysR substrate-binding domain-containing protein [Rhizomicrobium sp.]|nr:LysR substrate-binding domain-containing protein [Rhizomicrobium sp.]
MAFRALEAVVRHRSYSRAADELNVTHGAISQQMRRLEEQLGVPLFQRRGNGMEPLPAATRIASSVAAALALLERAVEETGPGKGAASLVVSVEQGFARRWLMPRLMRLREETGEHDLDLRLENRLESFVGEGIDAAIRYGDGEWPGLEASNLFMGRFFPVCSPAFLQAHPLTDLTDLYNVPLLRHTHPLWSWPHWFRSLGLPPPSNRGMMFDDSSLMLDAAAEGAGIALARETLVEKDLRNGRLIRPVSAEVESPWGYFFVWRARGPRLASILALRDWLLREAGAAA